jgi:hypothetical protein
VGVAFGGELRDNAAMSSPETAATWPDATRPAEFAPPRFDDYELLAEIGRGGMGIVYKARQKTLDRVVALKMILPGSLAGDDDIKRFHTEAEATARLLHPGIVRVHEVGLADGRHFYSMDYIEGPSLSKQLSVGPLPGRTAARYVAAVARAIEHAHRHGILHRDLKPSNILLDADEQPHVTDFGLAKKLGIDSKQTATGAVLGTPSYMAPEQAAGKTKELGPACDVYGLGALLYELLTGRPPFKAETPLDTMLQVMERDPAPPCILNPKIDRDLETICLKCLEKDPRDRYPSAEAVAADLERFQNGDPILARSVNVLDRLARVLERSQHDVEFRNFASMLFYFAAIILTTHVAIFALAFDGPPYPLIWIGLARVAQFGLMGGVFWYYRPRQLMPTSAAERQLWSIWIAYLLASGVGFVVSRLLETPERPLDELTLFPTWSILSGMAMFIMGSTYWGRCYLFGIVFFAAALLTPFALHWAPLATGVLWAWALTTLGLRLRRMSDQATP